MDLDAESLFLLEENDIDDLGEMKEEEKKMIKKFILKKEKLKRLNNLKSKEKIETKSFNEKKEENDQISQEKLFKQLDNIIHPINTNSKCNYFFIISFNKDNIKDILLSCFSKVNNLINNLEYYLIHKLIETNKEQIVFIIQVLSEKALNKLYLSIKDTIDNEQECNCEIQINKGDTFFYLQNLKFEKDANNFAYLSTDIILFDFLNFFFDKRVSGVERYQKKLINDINELLQKKEKDFEITIITVLKYFKCCIEINIKPLFNKIILKDIIPQKKKLKEEDYFSEKDIDILLSEENKQKIIDIFTKIYVLYDIKYFLKLINSKNGKSYIECLLNLLKDKFLDNTNFNEELNNEENLFFQNNLIDIASNRKEIIEIIKLSKGITNYLNLINSNFLIIYQILEADECDLNNPNHYELEMVFPSEKANEDLAEIKISLVRIIDQVSEIKYRILNLDKIFESLVEFFSNRTLPEFCELKLLVN